MADFEYSAEALAAIEDRMPEYNGNPYDVSTNPFGMDAGGYEGNFLQANSDIALVATEVAEAANFAQAAADAAGAYADKMDTVSTSSVAIGAGVKTFAISSETMFRNVGRWCRAQSRAAPLVDFMLFQIGSDSSATSITGTVDAGNAHGSGTHIDWDLLITEEPGDAGTVAIGAIAALAPGATPVVQNVGTPKAAELEFGIPVGAPAGLAYLWSTNTDADANPGAGNVKASSASLEAAAFIYISETDADGRAVAADIGTWDASTSTNRGRLFLKDPVTPANFVEYTITGDIIDQGAWRKIPVTHIAHGGTLTNSLRLYVQNTTKGDAGQAGAAGAAATIAVGAVTTGAAGSAAAVNNSGTSSGAVFDITIPRGDTGARGPVVALRLIFDDSTTDADPGSGEFRFNNATLSSVTAMYIDNAEAGGGSIGGIVDTFDDSTNTTHKGLLYFVAINDPTIWALFKVTGTVTDAAPDTYRKVNILTHLGSNGAFAAGSEFGMLFAATANKGTDGAGAGDVIGPASSGDSNIAGFDGTDGKLLKDLGVLTAFAKTILDDANQGAAQATLGLVPGTNVQAFHAILSALAGLANVSGLVEQTGAASFTQRLIGAGASTSVPTRADGDARWGQLAGFTMAGNITLVGDGSSSLHPVSKQQLDAAMLGMGKRARVRAATTVIGGNITIATALNNGDTLDGVTLATGDQVLVKNQTAAEENGIYVVGVSPARASEFDSYNEHPGAVIAVEEGSTNPDTLWWFTSNEGGTLNTTGLTVSQLFFTAYTAHATLVLTGNQFSLNLNNANTWTAAQTFGDGNLKLAGSSSGAGTLKAPAAASTYVWTLPAASVALASLTGVETFTNKRNTDRVNSAASASSITPDSDSYDEYTMTALAANFTINAPTGTPTDGQRLMFVLKDDGTSRTLTWNSAFVAIGVTAPTATTISKWLYVHARWNASATKWHILATGVEA